MNKITRLLFVLTCSGLLATETGLAEPTRPAAARDSHENQPKDAHGVHSGLVGGKQIERNPIKSTSVGPLHTQPQTQRWAANQHLPYNPKSSLGFSRGVSKLGKAEIHHESLGQSGQNKEKIAHVPNISHSRSPELAALGGPGRPTSKTTAAIGGESTPLQRLKR
jgi:hypothetical protein